MESGKQGRIPPSREREEGCKCLQALPALPPAGYAHSRGTHSQTSKAWIPIQALLLTSQVTLPRYLGPSHAEPLPAILHALCQGKRACTTQHPAQTDEPKRCPEIPAVDGLRTLEFSPGLPASAATDPSGNASCCSPGTPGTHLTLRIPGVLYSQPPIQQATRDVTSCILPLPWAHRSMTNIHEIKLSSKKLLRAIQGWTDKWAHLGWCQHCTLSPGPAPAQSCLCS